MMQINTLSSFALVALPLSMVSARSLPRSDSCGVVGYDAHANSYFYNDKGKYSTYSKCSDVCLQDPNCQSFGFDKNVCMYFYVPVAGNVENDDSSSITYYDRGCVKASDPNAAAAKSAGTTRASISSTTPSVVRQPTNKTTSSSSTTSTKASPNSVAPSTTAKGSSTNAKPNTSSTYSTTRSSTSVRSPLTTSKTSLSTTTTKSASPSSSKPAPVTVPSGCPIPSAYTITAFSLFNSSHNLNCVDGPDKNTDTGCIKEKDGQTVWCDPATDNSCTDCGVALCSTGLPPQPIGYGPPDDVKFTFADSSTCEQLNPAVVHRYPVGNGYVNCGSAYDFMNFYGSTDKDTERGRVEINGYSATCDDGSTIAPYYSTEFQYGCTRDAAGNATCATAGSFTIPLVKFTMS